jgi:hypothetical protein
MPEHLEVTVTMYGSEYSSTASATMRVDVSSESLKRMSIGPMCDGMLNAVLSDIDKANDKAAQEIDADHSRVRIAVHNAMEQIRNENIDAAFATLQEVE